MLAVAAALVLLTVATYTPVWRFGFVALDDPQYVYANPDLAAGLSAKTVSWAFSTGHEANWHPLTWLSHALDIQLFGLNAGAHHLTNLMLHLASTLLLFGLLRRMTGSIGRSAFVAALFAVHPVHVESVAWVAERKDVLSALFFMLTIGAYVRYVEAPGRARYLLVCLALALGLMAKAMLVTMPMVLLLLDFWPLGRVRGSEKVQAAEGPRVRVSWGLLMVEKVPLLALVIASSVVTFLVQRHGGAVKSLAAFPLAVRLQNVIVSYVDYLREFVWPASLGNFYPFPTTLPADLVAVDAAVLVAITVLAVWARRRAPFVAVGWFWFIGMLVPVIGFVQIGVHARADRYMYLPLIGLAILVAWGAVAVLRTDRLKRAAAMAGVAVILAGAIAAHAQVQYWRDTVVLWAQTAAVTEGTNNFGVYFGLAEYLRTTGRADQAVAAYEASIARNPSYLEARAGLVQALTDLKQPARAAVALEDTVRLNPASVEARMSLGALLVDLGRAPDAVVHFTEAVRLRPDSPDGHWRLALALAATGRLPDALPEFARAASLDPNSAPIRNDYGWTLAQQGQSAAAIAELTEALRLKPDFVDAHHNLGRVLSAEGRTPEALSHLVEAVRLEPDFIDARITLAVTLIRAGRVNDAANEFREVLRRDPQNAAAQRALKAIGREE